MIKEIIVIGKPGCGKSNMIWYLSSLLNEDGVKINYISDRISLENAVINDIKKSRLEKDGSRIGSHSKLIADGPPGHRKVHVLDGKFLNTAHEDTISSVVKAKNQNGIILAEYAIGPDINFGPGKEILYQSAGYLVKLIQKYRVLKNIFVLDIEAKLPVRAYRESRRPDAMAPETFRAYFPDGGEMTDKETKILGRQYYRFNNQEEDHEGYYSEARYMYETLIKPNLNTKNLTNSSAQ